jgi:hypothetical protein
MFVDNKQRQHRKNSHLNLKKYLLILVLFCVLNLASSSEIFNDATSYDIIALSQVLLSNNVPIHHAIYRWILPSDAVENTPLRVKFPTVRSHFIKHRMPKHIKCCFLCLYVFYFNEWVNYGLPWKFSFSNEPFSWCKRKDYICFCEAIHHNIEHYAEHV